MFSYNEDRGGPICEKIKCNWPLSREIQGKHFSGGDSVNRCWPHGLYVVPPTITFRAGHTHTQWTANTQHELTYLPIHELFQREQILPCYWRVFTCSYYSSLLVGPWGHVVNGRRLGSSAQVSMDSVSQCIHLTNDARVMPLEFHQTQDTGKPTLKRKLVIPMYTVCVKCPMDMKRLIYYL